MAVLKFSHKHAPSEVMVLIQNFLFLRFISQLLLKLGFYLPPVFENGGR